MSILAIVLEYLSLLKVLSARLEKLRMETSNLISPSTGATTTMSATRIEDFTKSNAGQQEHVENHDDEHPANPPTIVIADTAATTSKNNSIIGNDEHTNDLTSQTQSSSLRETLIRTTNVVYHNLEHAAAAQQEPVKLQDIVDHVVENLGLDDTSLTISNNSQSRSRTIATT